MARIDVNTDDLSGGVDLGGVRGGEVISIVVRLKALCLLKGSRHIVRI